MCLPVENNKIGKHYKHLKDSLPMSSTEGESDLDLISLQFVQSLQCLLRLTFFRGGSRISDEGVEIYLGGFVFIPLPVFS